MPYQYHINIDQFFYYLHQGTSAIILTLTGSDYYKPTFTIESDKLDHAKSQLAAPLKETINTFKNNRAQFSDEN